MADWIIGFIEQYGYVGVAALMMLENVFPPIPSELIMPFAGFVSARGTLDPFGVLAAGVAGSLAGTLPWYWLGRAVGRQRVHTLVARHGRWPTKCYRCSMFVPACSDFAARPCDRSVSQSQEHTWFRLPRAPRAGLKTCRSLPHRRGGDDGKQFDRYAVPPDIVSQ